MKQLIKETFPEDPHTALAIAQCESTFNYKAINSSNTNGTVDRGVMQINSVHDSRVQQLGLDMFDPKDNLAFARMLYDERGWQPWVCAAKIAK